jgi:hypothetical protein
MLAKPEGDLLLPTYRNKSNCHAGVHSVWYHRVSTLLELNLQVPATMGLVQSILQAVQRAIPVVINPGMVRTLQRCTTGRPRHLLVTCWQLQHMLRCFTSCPSEHTCCCCSSRPSPFPWYLGS